MSSLKPIIAEKTFTAKSAFWTGIGLIGVSFGLTVIYFGMRAVMAIGGFCAEGGPYVIAVPCPDNVAWLMPLSIFSMIIGLFIYMGNRAKNGPDWTLLWWSALFLSLGWNFAEFGINPPGGGLAWGDLICAVLFGLLGLVPFLLIGNGGFPHPIFGREPDKSEGIVNGLESRGFLLVLHFGSVIAGFLSAQLLLGFLS